MPKKCIHENCMKTPIYNISTEQIALYCNIHKLENMIDIKSKRCIHANCITQPSCNLPTEKIALYCNLHKLENMF